MRQSIQAFLRDESGATAIEYGLLAALIAVVIIVAVSTLGQDIKTTFENVSTCIKDPKNAVCK